MKNNKKMIIIGIAGIIVLVAVMLIYLSTPRIVFGEGRMGRTFKVPYDKEDLKLVEIVKQSDLYADLGKIVKKHLREIGYPVKILNPRNFIFTISTFDNEFYFSVHLPGYSIVYFDVTELTTYHGVTSDPHGQFSELIDERKIMNEEIFSAIDKAVNEFVDGLRKNNEVLGN